MKLILELSLHGTLAFLLVWILDRLLARHMSTIGRRTWWALLPFAFLVSIPLPVLPASFSPPLAQGETVLPPLMPVSFDASTSAPGLNPANGHLFLALWATGAAVYLLTAMIQTRSALRRWSSARFSTDPGLLNLLEDCKAEAGTTAPIGLVVTDMIAAPALLGWLRPRILLPRELALSMPPRHLRAVLLHELAHFRFLDIPLNWLFTLVCSLHWFNPFAHLAFRVWIGFREEAADEAAMGWMKEPSGATYGRALLDAMRHANGASVPFGALAIGESLQTLKKRMTMIDQHRKQSPRFLVVTTVLAAVVLAFIARPTRADDVADPKPAAVAAMQAWLQEIDGSQYAPSWKDASPTFHKALTSDQWVSALNAVRSPLGKCTSRTLASALHQTEVPSPTGTIKGDFIVAQFDSSFENLKYAVETVCFEKDSAGAWKSSGYYIKPKT